MVEVPMLTFSPEFQNWIIRKLETEKECLVCMDEMGRAELGELVLWCSSQGIKVTVPNENEFTFNGNKIFNLRRKLMILT